MEKNRYGSEGVKECRHNVSIFEACARCTQLLFVSDEQPHFVGVGPYKDRAARNQAGCIHTVLEVREHVESKQGN